MIVVDNSFLTLMLHPAARPPLNPSTGLPVERLGERIELFIDALEEDRETIIIPTPVLTEFLILAGNDGSQYLSEINNNRSFRIESFDQRAAIELAAIHLAARMGKSKRADKREGIEGTWAKINFDRQIVAIAKTNNAGTIYSDDEGLGKFAERRGISIVRTWELPFPQEKQNGLPFDEVATDARFLINQHIESEIDTEEAPTGITTASTLEERDGTEKSE